VCTPREGQTRWLSGTFSFVVGVTWFREVVVGVGPAFEGYVFKVAAGAKALWPLLAPDNLQANGFDEQGMELVSSIGHMLKVKMTAILKDSEHDAATTLKDIFGAMPTELDVRLQEEGEHVLAIVDPTTQPDPQNILDAIDKLDDRQAFFSGCLREWPQGKMLIKIARESAESKSSCARRARELQDHRLH
jgi:hypothetical protein